MRFSPCWGLNRREQPALGGELRQLRAESTTHQPGLSQLRWPVFRRPSTLYCPPAIRPAVEEGFAPQRQGGGRRIIPPQRGTFVFGCSLRSLGATRGCPRRQLAPVGGVRGPGSVGYAHPLPTGPGSNLLQRTRQSALGFVGT